MRHSGRDTVSRAGPPRVCGKPQVVFPFLDKKMAEEKLIEAVREHKELYDTKDENYMKTKLKNRIWEDIANDLNLKDGKFIDILKY